MLLDEESVTAKSGARLFTSRPAFLEELARIGEPRETVKGLEDDPPANSGAPAKEDASNGDGDEQAPAAAVVM